MYHRFDDAKSLERHCAHLHAHYNPVSLTHATDWLKAGCPLPQTHWS